MRMLTCKDVTRVVASDEYERLSGLRKAAVRLHLLWCRHCRRYRARLEALGRAARSVFRPDGPDPDLERLERSILDTLPGGRDPGDG